MPVPTINGSDGYEPAGSVGKARVGTWNLNTAEPAKHRSPQRDWLQRNAELWMLTEVHQVALPGLGGHVLGEGIEGLPNRYWAGIASVWPLEPVASGHPTLALARARVPGMGTILVASSVLPWRGAGRYWPPGDGEGFQSRFLAALSRHHDAIVRARQGETVIWGGDFNQALCGPESVGSDVGRKALLEAFESLGVRALTSGARGVSDESFSIDHICVARDLNVSPAQRVLPGSGGRALSDHPAYVAEIRLSTG